MSNYWKKKMEELENESKISSMSYWEKKMAELEEEKKKKKDRDDEDIAPVKSQEDDGKLDFFQSSSLFDDGWDFGDVTRTILGSVGDAGLNAVKGVAGLGEGLVDLAGYGIAGVADRIGLDSVADDLRERTQVNAIDNLMKPAEDYLDRYSIFGRTSDAILQGVGQVGGILATGGIGSAAGLGTAGVTALTTGVMGLSGMGSGMSEAYQGGATDEEATLYGAISGTADAISELIFGGLGKAVNAVGLSRGLSSADDMLAKKVSSMFSKQIAKNFAEFGIKAGAEGVEEVLAGIAQAAGKKATYMSEEEFGKILKDENLLEQFVVGAVSSGIAQAPGLQIANKTKSDFIAGISQNELLVMDKEVENRIAEAEADGKKLTKKEKAVIQEQVQRDMEKGYISTDTIESVLSGDSYKSWQQHTDMETKFQERIDELENLPESKITVKQSEELRSLRESLAEHKKQYDTKNFKSILTEKTKNLVSGTRLAESYNEKSRRGQKFEADLNKYDFKQQAVIKKAVESGILNNTNRTHEFVDMVAKISADKGVLFDFTNNEKLKKSGFAVNGKTVNGYVTKDGITVNVQSSKALNSIVGHEITHVLEGTELYNELQKAIFDYAKPKGEYLPRYNSMKELYKDVYKDLSAEDYDANINAEITADLVGDLLFTDQDFINNLSTQHRNVFQKIYDEVKYLLKVATAGSKEARELEKVKRAFEKAYRESGKAQGDTKYSISETTDGRSVAVVDNDILSHIDTSKWNKDTKAEAKKAANEALKVFSNGFSINGVEYIGNKKSRDEYTRSRYSEALANKNPEAYLDKMRAASVLDDVVRVATDWSNDGYLKHGRPDFVDFIRGKTLIKSGDHTYSAVVLAGITEDGRAVFYDVEDIYPDSFEIKESELSTAVATNKSPNAILESSDGDNLAQEERNVKYSLVEDQKTIDFLENQEHIVTYKAMVLIDGKLYPPMASQSRVEEEYTDKKGNKKTKTVRKLKNPSILGKWQQADERPDLAEKSYNAKRGYSSFDLLKSNGKTVPAAYNPYEHTSNIVLNDQFEEAYNRPELVTVEYHIPVSELSSGYKADYAKDAVGQHSWKSGPVAKDLKDPRQVYLTRWSKPVRIVPDSEVATKYKEILDGTGLSVPFNVVTPSLLSELEKAGVSIDYEGSPMYKSIQRRAAAKEAKYSLSADSSGRQLSKEQQEYFKDSAIRDKDGNLMVLYHGTQNAFTVFDIGRSGENYDGWSEYGEGIYLTPEKKTAQYYGDNAGRGREVNLMEMYADIKNPFSTNDPVDFDISDLAQKYELTEFDERFMKKYGNRLIEFLNHHNESVRDYLTSKGYDGVWETIDGDVYQVIAYAENQVKNVDNTKPTENPDIRYSLSDSNGKKLSAEQSEYFKDSKVRDASGNLMVMYHGTPNGDFTVFKDGTYFTASKEYADRYQNPGASSISTGKVASNPKTFEVYLDIKKPFDINDAEAREIYINDYIKGGNAIGINPYLSDAEYAQIRTIDWTEGEDLRDFLIENEYDYDGLVLDEGGTGGYGDEVQSRGKSYVVFSPEQVKNIDNKNPTSDPDIRFSLSEAVEETKDLLAVHNLRGSELIKSLELGGLPMPSIAILKANAVHDEYGEVSLILRKDAIDPEVNGDNKVYGGDAWTPTYPRIEYKPRKSVEDRISDKYYDLARRIGYDEVRPLYSYVTDLERQLNNNRGEAAILEYLYEDTDMMQVYLQDVGKGKIQPVEKETVTKISEVEATMNQFLLDALGKNMIAGFATPAGENPRTHRMAFIEDHRAEIETAYKRLCMEVYDFTEEQADNVVENSGDRDLMKILRDVLLYSKNNGITVKTETDYAATRKKILEAASDGYKEWVDSLFKGVEEKSGIRNNVDYWTRSGNRRSWDALHWENTLENVVKTMKADRETGGGSMSPFTDLFGESHKKYGSIAEIKADSDRLGKIDQEEYEKIKDSFSKRFAAIANSIKDPGERNSFIAADTAAEQITDAVRNRKTKSGILTYLRKYNSRATMQTVDDVLALVSDIANMPTGYFEAKPRRAVSFDEVGVFVIPNNADVKLKQELLNRGYSIAEYDPNVEGDRQRVVNQFEEYKFSLSDAGAASKTYGSYNVYGKDIAFEEAPVQEEIAPTVSEMENVAPVAISKTETTTEGSSVAEMFPDDLAPMPLELDRLKAEQTELRQALESAMDQGDYNQVSSLTADYEAVTSRIREIQAQEDERISTLGEADMPAEAEAPYPGEPSKPADPFADRDMHEVGKRGVKAYQYENPEVKPFFTEAALGMLDDLHRSIKGEKIFNGDLYYQSGGEEGWTGTKRQTTDDIAELLDEWHYTYGEIEKGLNAIIEDDGKENNAVSKRIEFMLNDRLRDGYMGVWGEYVPPNQEYINLLNEKQITEYSQESFDSLFARGDEFAPPAEENDISPIAAPKAQEKSVKTTAEDVAPVYENAGGQQSMFPEEPSNSENTKTTRKTLHAGIIERVKASFAEKGFDFDHVLRKAKNLSTFATVDNTPQRVMEKALGYKEGGILADFTVNKVAQNESESIKWLNSFTDRKKGLLAQISKQYQIKPGSKESAAAQMYAEGFYVDGNNNIVSYGDRELAIDFPDMVKQAQIKGLARDSRIRQIYDDTLKAINESRTRNAYPEIPRLDNYFLHFRAMNDTFSNLGLPFNPNYIRAKDLPTDLNGVTADLKPGQPFFASAMHREGKRTSFDLLGGLEQYLNSAKNQIYHIDDIQNLRALRNYIADTYGQANGLEGLDALSEEEAQQRIEQVYNSHLSTFAKFLNEEANMLAGKTALIDRGIEGIIGRRGMTFLDTLNRQVGANMVGYNVSSSLTNFLAPVQAFAKTNKFDFVKGFAQTVSNRLDSLIGAGDNFADNSPVMIRRKGADKFHRTFWQKMSDPGYLLMSAVDDISTEIIARAKYNEFTRKGMEPQQAHFETDKWVSRLMGDRSLGQQPQLYNSKMLGIITKFQLEVRNQLDSQFYDTIQEAKISTEDIQNQQTRNAKTAAKVTSTLVQLAVAQHLFGKAFESVAGYNPAFDIISAIIKTFGWDDEEESEDTVLDNIEQGFFELMEDMPYYSTFTGGRIPIESALPIKEFVKGEDQYGNEKSRWETLGEAAPYYFMPGGYGQIKKSVAGLKMFSDDHPIAGSYTDSGNLRFPVEDTFGNRAQAAIFGQYASGNARDYFDNERSALKPKQIQEFIDVGMTIQDYWKYREGLSGLSKLEEKINYINGLNLTMEQKNILVNNLTDRKDPIDMSDYDEYSGLEEFDYANKNPEKYAFFEEIGITYETYKNADDDTREAYDWAYRNPEQYPVSKAVSGDVVTYRRFTSALNDIKADKDSSGKTISGSRKAKVLNYINNLPIEYGAKLILFKSEYPSDDESNYKIIEYLNNRSDISYDEEVTILRELGFTVTSDGTIYWD